MFEALIEGIIEISQPWPMFLMIVGILVSSIFAALPGVGELMLLTIILPFAITLDPYPAIALLLGISAVSNTANTFPSVLIAVPGGGGSQATILDGYPMAKRGEANRALGAAFTASPLGGIFGAVVLFVSLPILRPLVLSFGSPEFLMLVIWGLCAVGTLSGKSPVKGLVVAAFGVLISSVGVDNKTGIERFDFGGTYLWDGVSLVMVGLGIFAIPEMVALAVRRTSISSEVNLGRGLMQGVRDTFENWWLVIRCSAIGVWVGFLPGLGGAVAAWFAYAHAKQSEKNSEGFGKGDVRGVIGPEASNNAKEGGSLIPTVAFGIPGSSTLALIMTAFIAVGILPGAAMLSTQLNYTMAMVWVLVISNILAAALAILAIGPFVRLTLLPFYIIVPMTLVLCITSSFSVNYLWDDILVLLVFSVIGYLFKLLNWPRPPLLVAVVLGTHLETSLWISQARYGWKWLLHPMVIGIMVLIVVTLIVPYIRTYLRHRHSKIPPEVAGSGIRIADQIFSLFLIGVFVTGVVMASQWGSLRAALVIYSVAAVSIPLIAYQMVMTAREARTTGVVHADGPIGDGEELSVEGLGWQLVALRTLEIFGWLLGLAAGVVLTGFHVAVVAFIVIYVKFYRGSWKEAVIMAVLAEGFVFLVFDVLLRVAWPTPLLARLFI